MEQLLMNAGITTSGVAILLIAYKVFKSLEGKKLISSCCGKKMEVGFQVGEMTPQHTASAPKDEFVVVNPTISKPADAV